MKLPITEEELDKQEWKPARFYSDKKQAWVTSDTHEITQTGYVRDIYKDSGDRISFNPNAVKFGHKGTYTKFNLAASIYATFIGPISPNERVRRRIYMKRIAVEKQVVRREMLVQADEFCRIIHVGNTVKSLLDKNKNIPTVTYCTIYNALGSGSHVGGKYRWFYLKDFNEYIHPKHIKLSGKLVELAPDGSISRIWLSYENAARDLNISLDTLYSWVNSIVLDKSVPFLLDRSVYDHLIHTHIIKSSFMVEEEWRPLYYIEDKNNTATLVPGYEISNLLNVRKTKNKSIRFNSPFIRVTLDGKLLYVATKKAAYYVFKEPLEKGEQVYLVPTASIISVDNLISSRIVQFSISGKIIREWLSTSELKAEKFKGFPITKLLETEKGKPLFYRGFYWQFADYLPQLDMSVFDEVSGEEWRPIKYFDTELGRYTEAPTMLISNKGNVRTTVAVSLKSMANKQIYIPIRSGKSIRITLARAVYATFVRELDTGETIRIIDKNLPITACNVESHRIIGIDMYDNTLHDWLTIAAACNDLNVSAGVLINSLDSGKVCKKVGLYLYRYDTYYHIRDKVGDTIR